MKQIVFCDESKCLACNRCVRVCPVEGANVAYDKGGEIGVKINPDNCIACGTCIDACKHNARYYIDDIDSFLSDLKSGVKMSIIVAPSARVNHDDLGRLLTWLRNQGVSKIYDVSLGADICTWAHIRYIQESGVASLVTQPCPAIVNYAEKHSQKLMSRLSPIQSPMLCTAIYMRKYEGITEPIAALSPCIAKSNEFEETGLVDYNVTFKKLFDYLDQKHIELPHEESGFDHYKSALGGLYSMPGGLKENVEFFLGKSLRIDKAEGRNVYHMLTEYCSKDDNTLPAVFDVLNCQEGCNSGTGCRHDKDFFEANTVMDGVRKAASSDRDREYFYNLYEQYDKQFNLDDFKRTYKSSRKITRVLSEDDIDQAFNLLEKSTYEQRNFNCGACGAETCYGMARMIALGYNIPQNCVEKSRLEMKRDHESLLKSQEQTDEALKNITEIINHVKPKTDDISNDINDLNGAIQAYKDMAKSINDISSNINLISINASIEAARAGNQGKTFGVIAEEIRTLAQKSHSVVDKTYAISDDAYKSIKSVNSSLASVMSVLHEQS